MDQKQKLPLLITLRIATLRFLAAFYLICEAMAQVFLPLGLWCALFASLWLLQVPQWFGMTAEVITSIVFILGCGIITYRYVRGMRMPDHFGITRRIEQDNHLAHRPLTGLEDMLANPERAETRRLWALWQKRLEPTLLSLQWPRLRGVLPRFDPYALRAFALCLLLVSLAAAGETWDSRLRHGMVPFVFKASPASSENVVIWITPPAYTGQPMVTLKGFSKKGERLTIPADSVIKARVSGWPGRPEMVFDDTVMPMVRLGEGSFGIEKTITAGNTITIRQMMIPRSRWNVEVKPDTPPTMILSGKLEVKPKGEIIVPLKLQDDYSVESLSTSIALAKPVDGTALGAPFSESRTILSPAKTEVEIKAEFDLTWHPWAGQPVRVTLQARDHKEQSAFISDLTVTLPERPFQDPVARKLAALRKRLIWTPEAAAGNVANELENILARPGLYRGDTGIFLSLRAAVSRLSYDSRRKSIATVIPLLWDIALKIEDGNFSLAQRDLRDAQKELQDVLKDPNATPEEIATKMENLRMAMAQYLQEMFRELQKKAAADGQNMPMMSPESIMQNINPEDIAAFLDKMQAEALSGNRDAAREMLARMEQMMSMMDPSTMQTSMPKQMQDLMEAMQKLQQVIEQQKKLLEQTMDKATDAANEQAYSAPLPQNTDLMKEWGISSLPPPPQETMKGQAPPKREISTKEDQTTQNDIRKTLGEAMQDIGEKLGQIPDTMAKADQAMSKSSESLGENKPDLSVPHQEDAIKYLSEGQQSMAQQLAQGMKQMMMFSFGMGGRTDPLGRPMGDDNGNNPWSTSKVKIPDKAERRQVQDVLEQLRKKSGELQRPAYELDYFRRLMRQF